MSMEQFHELIFFFTDKETILFLFGVLATFIGFSVPKIISWLIKRVKVKEEKKYLIMTILEDMDLLLKYFEDGYTEAKVQEASFSVIKSVLDQLNYLSKEYYQDSFTDKKSQPIRKARQNTKMILLTASSKSSYKITSELKNEVYNILENYLKSL